MSWFVSGEMQLLNILSYFMVTNRALHTLTHTDPHFAPLPGCTCSLLQWMFALSVKELKRQTVVHVGKSKVEQNGLIFFFFLLSVIYLTIEVTIDD